MKFGLQSYPEIDLTTKATKVFFKIFKLNGKPCDMLCLTLKKHYLHTSVAFINHKN
ncbi:hypothetical protein ELBR111191_19675 [Elizabethkingia bruuniana]